MANELVAYLNKRNRVGITNALFQLFSTAGDLIEAIPATEVAGEAVYRASIATTTPDGDYTWRLQRSNNDQALAYGDLTIIDGSVFSDYLKAQQLKTILDIAQADEVYTPTSAKKLLKGTNTVLVNKNVVSDTECTVNTSLIESNA